MRRAWQVASLACAGLGAFAAVQSLDYTFYDRTGPGAGFFPFWLGLLLAAASLALFLRATLGSRQDFGTSLAPDRPQALRVLSIFGGLVGVTVLLERLGFRLTLLLFLAYVPLALGARNWLVAVILAVIGSLGVFHVFYYWLQVPLPIGQLGI